MEESKGQIIHGKLFAFGARGQQHFENWKPRDDGGSDTKVDDLGLGLGPSVKGLRRPPLDPTCSPNTGKIIRVNNWNFSP